MRYLVTIPVDVTENSPVTNPNNGFLVNMSSQGDAVADGSSSDYTYTLDIVANALAKIAAYAENNANPAPTVADYAEAGVTGVDAANLDDVNDAVDALVGVDVDTTPEVQALVDTEIAEDVAQAKIEAYADDNTNPEPTVADYAEAGVTGVTADNLADVNEAVDALVGVDVDTTPEVQALVDAVNAAVDAEIASDTVLAEIGADDDANASDVTIAELNSILPALTDVNASNEAAYQAYIADPANAFDAPATQAQVQAMIDAVNAAVDALAVIVAYAEDNTNPAPTVQDYADAGVTGVDAANLDDVNDAVDALVGVDVDTTPEVQALVDGLYDIDMKPVLTVYGGIVNGSGVHNFSFDTLVLNALPNTVYNATTPLTIKIPKNDALTLVFDSTETTFKGVTVENALWSFDDSDAFDYIITYIGSEMSTGQTRFSVQGTLTVEDGEVGKFFLETTIKLGTGGDINAGNNVDREILEKRL
jgi:hypothetical protein